VRLCKGRFPAILLSCSLPTKDGVLQARLISHPDAHRYRLGVNYEALPVKPQCPVMHYHRDGAMRLRDLINPL